MKKRFEFATATRILFGRGTLGEVPPAAAQMGLRALVVQGRAGERVPGLVKALTEHGVRVVPLAVAGEPTLVMIAEGVRKAAEEGCDVVIGMGGGSVLDAAKAVAALATNAGDILDYLEVIGRGKPITRPALPLIAIPTTAGTGAEVTMNAVLASPEHRAKVSLRNPMMLPRLAVVDPELTLSLRPPLTASTGLDALTQLLEAFVSRQANPLTDSLCREGLRRAGRSLRRAFVDGADQEAREDMSLASLFSGLALANARLGAVHGLAAAIGGMFPAPHGVVCARLLAPVTRANVLKAREERVFHVLERFQEVAAILTARPEAHPEEAVEWISALCEGLEVPPLAAFGVVIEEFPEIVSRAARASSMKGNPVDLTEEELMGILRVA